MINKDKPPVNVPPLAETRPSGTYNQSTLRPRPRRTRYYEVYNILQLAWVLSLLAGFIFAVVFGSKLHSGIMALICIVGGVFQAILFAALAVIVRACVKYLNNEP